MVPQNAVRCGEIINSLERKNGTIESPNYPRSYPAELTCRFTFQGVGRERIQLRFVHMDLHFPSGDPADPMECTGSDSVTVYITVNGQPETLDTYCGEKLPPMLMSNSHTMTVEFRSYRSSNTVTGFRANFEFVTNFGIKTGKQDSRGTCIFNYMSHKEPDGHIMSPNYPGLYPRNTECHYLFYGRGKERVHITFLYFEVDGIPPRCEENTNSDYVSFSNFAETEDRKLYRMCGQSPLTKQKIESDGAFFRVTFKSNHIYDAHGFQAFYQFFGGPDPTEKPGAGQMSNPNWNNGNGGVASTNTGHSMTSATSLFLLLLCLLTTSLPLPLPQPFSSQVHPHSVTFAS
ncbi:suppressor of lurcher protein 1-like [Littorina saxatilis]|uniref:suppressor of lurcher protein 1-like n=1 Tax=Littorina saxatilis TaxID=31220 RepID=UPI0038B49AE3